jgi:hypothetical protein
MFLFNQSLFWFYSFSFRDYKFYMVNIPQQ